LKNEPIVFEDIYLYAPNLPKPNTLFNQYSALGNPCTEIQTKFPDDAALCIVFDYGDFDRLQVDPARYPETTWLGFDHHSDKTNFPIDGFEIVDDSASSATMLLTRFFRDAQVRYHMTADVATCLFTGLVADTGRFAYLINSGTFEISAYLADRGARVDKVVASTLPNISLASFKVRDKIKREKVNLDELSGIATISFSRADLERWHAEERDALSVFGSLRNIEEMRLVAAYYEREDGRWYCSLRSDNGLAKKVAEHFGGGGHPNAAGFMDKSRRDLNAFFAELCKIVKNV
jgi:phosphoesterase RecJ-like protein